MPLDLINTGCSMNSPRIRKIISILMLVLWGFLASLFIDNLKINSVGAQVAQGSNQPITLEQSEVLNLERTGQQFYYQGNYQDAIRWWQKAQQSYQTQGNILLEARVLSNLGLVHCQIGAWQEATAYLDAAYNLASNQEGAAVDRVLAQIFNNQGILLLATGEVQNAIASWQKSQKLYDALEDERGLIRSAVNQASGFKSIGFYHRALRILSEVAPKLEKQDDSGLKAMGLRNYGDILRLSGRFTEARLILNQSLALTKQLNLPQERVKTLLALGNLLLVQSNYSDKIGKGKAFKLYQQALQLCQETENCSTTDIPLQINLAQFNLLLATKSWQRADALIPEIKADFKNIVSTRDRIHKQIRFAHSLLKLYRRAKYKQQKLSNISSLSEIELLIENAIASAQALQDYRLESYALGLQGQIRELLQKWQIARDLTNQALKIAHLIDAPEISYLWEWQLARIDRGLGNRQQAIAHYEQSISLLESLSQDLVTIDPNIQYSFRDTVEPVYRQSLDLLLTTDDDQPVTQLDLQKALNTIESLQIAELNNFFRVACFNPNPVKIDRIDRHAAAIYTMILRDRLEVIVSLPKQPLIHNTTIIRRQKLEAIIEQLRDDLVIRSRRDYYEPAEKLYDYLIRPILEDLQQNQIETLVFVSDGVLRNIPLATLYDGKHYLIEDYNLVINPGLQLLNPRSLQEGSLSTLSLGITQERLDFEALEFVDMELAEIENLVKSTILIDENFTTKTFREKVQVSDFPIVHIATHGQFSSSLENTFLLAWDNRIKINQLDSILQSRTLSQEQAIELLVLSACETAAGDKWAALGLAGMAVKAGAKSTIATLWSVNDRATATLMSHFYEELVINHQEKSQAIREAQLALLKDSKYQHPFYWAPYVLVGNWL